MSYLVFASRCLLLVVFAVSLVGKVRFASFRQATIALVPRARRFASLLAGAVIAAELAIVVLLAIPQTVRAGLGAAFLLLTAFTVAIVLALRRGSTAPCRCFGSANSPLGTRHLVRNAILLLVAASGFAMGDAHGGEPFGLAMAGGVAVIAAVLVVNSDALADLFAGPLGPPRPKRNTT